MFLVDNAKKEIRQLQDGWSNKNFTFNYLGA